MAPDTTRAHLLRLSAAPRLAPSLRDIEPLLAEFIGSEEHYRPDGHLMTLAEVNRAFTRRMEGVTEGTIEGGIAAELLRKLHPELHAQMRELAPGGHRPKHWQRGIASTAAEVKA